MAKQWSKPPEMQIDPKKKYKAHMETDKGTMVIELFADKAPKTVNNFVFLAREGYYEGVMFHRVIPNFMAQGGDPTGRGSGGPGYQFEDEFHPSLLPVFFKGPFLFGFFDGDTFDLYSRSIDVTRITRRDGHQHIQSLDNLTKDTVPVIQMRRGTVRDKELRAIRTRSCIRHGEDALFIMFEAVMKFIFKLIAGSPGAGMILPPLHAPQ